VIDWTKLHPDFAHKLTALVGLLKDEGLKMQGASGYRSLREQGALYAKGRTRPGAKVTNAPPGSSAHNWGCGCDFIFVDGDGKRHYDGNWNLFGVLVKRAGLTWGGDFHSIVDRPHCELTTWRNVRDEGWTPPLVIEA
jgi:peptidoglycan L-alanyl-D-glutamate endopeptidase CwlK